MPFTKKMGVLKKIEFLENNSHVKNESFQAFCTGRPPPGTPHRSIYGDIKMSNHRKYWARAGTKIIECLQNMPIKLLLFPEYPNQYFTFSLSAVDELVAISLNGPSLNRGLFSLFNKQQTISSYIRNVRGSPCQEKVSSKVLSSKPCFDEINFYA